VRFYTDFPEAINEIRRELKEMGIRVHTKSVQNKNIEGKDEFDTLECQNYIYTVTQPNWRDVPLRTPAWGDAEFVERTSEVKTNPGQAWKLREDYWKQFLVNGRFDYAYPDRMAGQLSQVINALNKDEMCRRAFLPIWAHGTDEQDNFGTRVPCSLGYWFNYRQGKLNVTYLLRSSDFFEHFNYDIYLADRLKCFVAEKLNLQPGTFTHWIGSLHCFQKDVKDVF
jgi:thymidylate synthase